MERCDTEMGSASELLNRLGSPGVWRIRRKHLRFAAQSRVYKPDGNVVQQSVRMVYIYIELLLLQVRSNRWIILSLVTAHRRLCCLLEHGN